MEKKITEACSAEALAKIIYRPTVYLQHKWQALASTLSDENVSGSNTYELCKTGRRTPKNNKQYTLSSNKNYDFIYKLQYILYD